MCNRLKIVPAKFRDIVGLRSTVDQHFIGIRRSQRRAIWSAIGSLLKHGVFAAKRLLFPHMQLSTPHRVHSFGALNQGGCVTVVGYVDRKLTIYAIINKARLLKRAGESRVCTIIDEFVDPHRTSRVRVLVAEYKYIVWSIWTHISGGMKQRRAQLLEMLPEREVSVWQQDHMHAFPRA